MTPNEVADTSMWRFMSALDGYAQAHGGDEDNSLSSKEADELWEWVKEG